MRQKNKWKNKNKWFMKRDYKLLDEIKKIKVKLLQKKKK